MTNSLGVSRKQSIFVICLPKKRVIATYKAFAILYYIMLLALFPTISSCTKIIHVHEEFFARE
jgi:hypothetical protein